MYRPLSTRLWCNIQSIPRQYYRSMSRSTPKGSSSRSSANVNVRPSETDWNSNDDFFKFTRGRFIVEEAKNLKIRETRFDMNRLASVAADSVGASQCISIEKYPDGMYNKAFLMTMDNGREVVAKVPNPNAGIPHFTTASEVATMDFARNILDTPAPKVHSWNSRAESHPVGAEFIIMDKVEGIPLSQVWETMKLPQKLQVLLAITRLQTKWLSVSFSHYGSLYYTGDIRDYNGSGSHFVKDGKSIENSGFTIGPSTARDWIDEGRSKLDIYRGPWASPTDYLHAIGTREQKAIQSLKPGKQLPLFCGSKLYQPNTENKLEALSYYQKIVKSLIPKEISITNPYLWHDDLHDDNIFVDPNNPEQITGIIDWQSCHVSPLFNHNPDPAFLAWDNSNLEPETLDLAPRPNLSELPAEDRTKALEEYTIQNVFIAWRKLMLAKNPGLYQTIEFRKTSVFGLIFLAHRMFEYGEAHFLSLLLEVGHSWADLSEDPFPPEKMFSESDIERIKLDSEAAIAGTDLILEVKESLGDLWPDKGLIEHERYDECKIALEEVKGQILEQLAETEEERDEFERYWPFD